MQFFAGKETKEKKVERILTEEYDRYYRLAYSYAGNEADALDIVQNGAYRAILKSDTLKDEAYAATWIYRIMLNEIFRFCKAPVMESLEEAEMTQGKEDTYENLDLKHALDTLPVKDRMVVVLRYFEDRKLEEIAQILEENVSTVKSRLYRSLKKLQIHMSEV